MTFSYEKMYMIEEVLDKLINYTISHFTYEEKLMESANYPFLKEQKKANSLFLTVSYLLKNVLKMVKISQANYAITYSFGQYTTSKKVTQTIQSLYTKTSQPSPYQKSSTSLFNA